MAGTGFKLLRLTTKSSLQALHRTLQEAAARGARVAVRLPHRRVRGDEEGSASEQRHHLHLGQDPPVYPAAVHGSGENHHQADAWNPVQPFTAVEIIMSIL